MKTFTEYLKEGEKRWKQTSMSPVEAIKQYGKDNVKVKKAALRNGDDMVEVYVESVENVSEGFKIRDKSRGYGVSDKTYKTREEAKDAAVMKSASSGGDFEVIEETNEAEKRWKQTSMSPQEAIAKYGKENVKVKKGALRNGDDMVEVFVESMNEAGGYYTQPVYDMIKQHGYPKVMHRLLSALDADVIQDALSTMNTENESYSPGDEMEDGVVSNCCGAQLMDYNDGHGRCSDCKEMAAGERDEEYYESVNPDNLTEGVLDGDDEDGFMARSQLYFMAQDAIKLHGIIGDRDNLAPWVQSKIAQASKDIDAVSRYTEYNAMKAEIEPQMQPAPEMDEAQQLNASDYHCADCGDTMHNPTTNCSHDSHDETGSWWKDENGNGVPDSLEEAMDPASPELVAIFDNLKRGDRVKIKHDSALEKGTDYIEYVVKANNVLKNGVGKATLARADSPTSVKRVLYKRNGKVTMAIGDMAAT